MEDYRMKAPIATCPTEGWSILDAIANCCTRWQQDVKHSHDKHPKTGRNFVSQTTISLDGELSDCFNELGMICELGLLDARGRRGDPAAPLDEIPGAAWKHYELEDAPKSVVRTPDGGFVYDVRLQLPSVRRQRGRPEAGEWIRSYLKGRFSSESLGVEKPGELQNIAAEMLKVFARPQKDTLNPVQKPKKLASRTAGEWVGFYAKYGLETTRRRRSGNSAK